MVSSNFARGSSESARHAIDEALGIAGGADNELEAYVPADAKQTLASRITYFPDATEQALLASLDYQSYLEYHLNYEVIDDLTLKSKLASFSYLNMPIQDLVRLASSSPPISEIARAALMRAIYSKKQLFEHMVEFWTDHFNIDIGKVGVYKLPDDSNVIRKYAMTSFPELLKASGQSVGMLRYLDNDTNRKSAPNQNYARELMELHTLGVDGGYTQNDVIEVAKAFTGWTYYAPGTTPASTDGTFRFNSSQHDNTAKTVLGNSIPANGGMNDGLQVLTILANHVSTARFISKKLLKFFVTETPSTQQVEEVAQTYMNTGGDIKSILRVVLSEANMASAGPKYKRPFHLICGAMRAFQSDTTDASSLEGTWLNIAGHRPFRWSPPNGYPDTIGYWSSLILPRWNFMASLAQGSVSGVTYPTDRLGLTLTSTAAVIDKINQIVFLGAMQPTTQTVLQTFLNAKPITSARVRDAYGLALSSPQWQWR